VIKTVSFFPSAKELVFVSKEPRVVLDSIWAFPPNRDTLGGTAYFIVENSQNILIDCPSWDDQTQTFLEAHGGVQWFISTHRQGMSPAIGNIQSALGCKILVQEQEAYLWPELSITTFQRSFELLPNLEVFWTPGYSPGSACVYDRQHGGVLFTGRHLLPDQNGLPKPLRVAKTFHWFRQLKSVQLLLDRFNTSSLQHLCPGANTGFLRQQRSIDQAYPKLQQLDLLALREVAIGL
jgi:glyoxylase-like metal-dependent hydrolase (beta-lactamase superfamily II)